jgi:hypothetical protein
LRCEALSVMSTKEAEAMAARRALCLSGRHDSRLRATGRDGVGVRMGGGEGGAGGSGVEKVEPITGSDTKSAADVSRADC